MNVHPLVISDLDFEEKPCSAQCDIFKLQTCEKGTVLFCWLCLPLVKNKELVQGLTDGMQRTSARTTLISSYNTVDFFLLTWATVTVLGLHLFSLK